MSALHDYQIENIWAAIVIVVCLVVLVRFYLGRKK